MVTAAAKEETVVAEAVMAAAACGFDQKSSGLMHVHVQCASPSTSSRLSNSIEKWPATYIHKFHFHDLSLWLWVLLSLLLTPAFPLDFPPSSSSTLRSESNSCFLIRRRIGTWIVQLKQISLRKVTRTREFWFVSLIFMFVCTKWFISVGFGLVSASCMEHICCN